MTTKSQFLISIDPAVAEGIRTQARGLGVPIGDLVAFMARFANEKIPEAMWATWASGLKRTPLGRPPGATNRGTPASGARMLQAFEGLAVRGRGVVGVRPTAFKLEELANAAGLPVRDAWRALQALRVRGTVGAVFGDQLDRWGRPVRSAWWRTSDAVEGLQYGRAFSVIPAIRADAAAATSESIALHLAGLEVTKRTGWSASLLDWPDTVRPAPEGQQPTIRADTWSAWIEHRIAMLF